MFARAPACTPARALHGNANKLAAARRAPKRVSHHPIASNGSGDTPSGDKRSVSNDAAVTSGGSTRGWRSPALNPQATLCGIKAALAGAAGSPQCQALLAVLQHRRDRKALMLHVIKAAERSIALSDAEHAASELRMTQWEEEEERWAAAERLADEEAAAGLKAAERRLAEEEERHRVLVAELARTNAELAELGRTNPALAALLASKQQGEGTE